jgi:type I restriction enzyme S subunit
VSFSRYPAYKPSGVEWLGDVPEHWKALPLRRLIRQVTSGTSVNAIDEPASHGQAGVLKTSCVYTGEFRPEENKAILESELDRATCPVVAGTLVVSRMNTPGLVGAAGLVKNNDPYLFLPDRLWLVSFQDCDPQFMNYWCKSVSYRGQVQLACSGTSSSMQNLSQDNFYSFIAPLPPTGEQSAIAAFLDRETAKIDALIAEQQRLIELLQEKRQAAISNAVTKGLNPNARMKDSGVEWLGEVPEHWDVVQIKWLSPVKRGASPRPIEDPKYFDDCGEYAWVRISDVSSSSGRLEATSQYLSELGSSLSVKLEPGSLFVSIAGSVGKPCITRIKACIHDGFVYFPSLQACPEFLELIFISGGCFGGLGKLGTQLNLNTDTIGAIRIGIPTDDDEVDAIVEYCNQICERFSELEAAALSAVSLLSERRSALISAAVTGQIDVRGMVTEAIEK